MNRLIWYECKKLLKQNIIVVAIGCLFLLPFFFTRMIPNDSLVKEHFQVFRSELNDAWYEKAKAKLTQIEDFSSDIQYLSSFQFASMQENPDALSKEHLAQLQTKWAQDTWSDLRITGFVFTPLHAFQGIWEHCIPYLVGGIMISLVCTTLSQIVKSHMSALCFAIFVFYFTGMLPLSYPTLLPYYYLQNYALLRYSGYLELCGHLWESAHLNLLIASSIIVLLSIGFLLYFHPLWKHQRFRSSKR